MFGSKAFGRATYTRTSPAKSKNTTCCYPHCLRTNAQGSGSRLNSSHAAAGAGLCRPRQRNALRGTSRVRPNRFNWPANGLSPWPRGSDPIIGYKGARFKIVAADNTGITYEVLAHLGE